MGASPRPPGLLLGFPMVRQVLPRWCWAAVASGVDALRGHGRSQCAIAQIYSMSATNPTIRAALEGLTCPQDQRHDTPGSLSEVLSCTDLAATPLLQPVANTVTAAAAARNELNSGRPVPIRIAWTDRDCDAHFIALVGINSGANGEEFWVYDPSEAKDGIGHLWSGPVETIATSYDNRGRWTHMYMVK